MQHIIKKQGPMGLWRGFAPALILYIGAHFPSILYLSQESVLRIRKRRREREQEAVSEKMKQFKQLEASQAEVKQDQTREKKDPEAKGMEEEKGKDGK